MFDAYPAISPLAPHRRDSLPLRRADPDPRAVVPSEKGSAQFQPVFSRVKCTSRRGKGCAPPCWGPCYETMNDAERALLRPAPLGPLALIVAVLDRGAGPVPGPFR